MISNGTKGGPARLMKYWGNQCAYCNEHIWLRPTRYGQRYASVDHFIPVSKGGSGKLDNLVLTCRDCNSMKGNKMPEECLDAATYQTVSNTLKKVVSRIYKPAVTGLVFCDEVPTNDNYKRKRRDPPQL